MPVTAETATVYRAGRRRYLTLRAAVQAETNAIIEAKHPTEREERDSCGRVTFGGWHWSSLPRADVLERRLKRLVLKQFRG